MHPTASQHPSASDLSAFVRGTLGPAATEWITHHIEECDVCRTASEIFRHTPATETPSFQGTATFSDGGTQPPTESEIPPALRDHPRYRIVRQLGRGGMGVVYEAEHRVMERLVAVKVISRALVDRPDALERFRREVRAAAKLDHPNIVKAYDAEQAGDLQLLAMEYVEGHSLADVIAKKGPLPIAYACSYILQAAAGLQHAFEQGMVHRDLKPQNLMLTPKGVVKILDFGLAKLASEQSRVGGALTQENVVMGTPEYMAPEQAINTKAADIRADIYALGCTLYCLLAGRPPFAAESSLAVIIAHAQQEPPPIELVGQELPAPLAALVRRMLAKNPNDRPQTPQEVAEALAPFARRTPQSTDAMTVETPYPGQPAPRRRRWLLPTTIAAGLALVALGVWGGAMLKARAKEGLLVVEINEPNAEVFVDGERKNVKWADGEKTTVIRVTPGEHKIEVKKDGFITVATDIAIEEHNRKLFTALLKPAVKKPGVEALEQLGSELGRMNYGQSPVREKWRQHAVDEVKAALTAIESESHALDSDIGGHLDRVRADITELKAASNTNALNKRALAESQRYLDAAIAARTIPKGESRIAGNFAGQWSIEGQELIQSQSAGIANLRFGNAEWTDYDFSFDLQLVRGTGHATAVVRSIQAPVAYFYWLGAGLNSVDRIVHGLGPRQSNVLISRENPQATLQPGRWQTVRVRVRGDQCWCYRDDDLWLQCQNLTIRKGRVGLNTSDAVCRFRNIRVTDAAGALLWAGMPTLPEPTAAARPTVADTPVVSSFVPLFNGAEKVSGTFLRDNKGS